MPPSEHAQAAIFMLEAGKHVLIKKPMALSLVDCDRIIKASAGSKKLLSVISQNRYKVPVMKVKRLIDEQAGERILFCTVNSLWWRGENYYDLWWRSRWETEGGGCLINHAVHHVDLLQWMVGMPSKVTAVI